MPRQSRADLKLSQQWLRSHRAGAFLILAILLLAGFASVFGLLRWQADIARWSFALLCWAASALVAWVALGSPTPD
jgi:hypothetical protein